MQLFQLLFPERVDASVGVAHLDRKRVFVDAGAGDLAAVLRREAHLKEIVGDLDVPAILAETIRDIGLGVEQSPAAEDMPRDFNDFEVAARESAAAFVDGKLWGFIRHARISEEQASEFWERMAELVTEFDRLSRSGETVYGFAVGVYPTDHPTLPDASGASEP